ncbi:choline ABC transporter substrate-binding protein [Falsirhodobacter halotolerans]|uniref:choline ABC transporter substrate-binding protein n=1 Tax=Falsirhodobacter halotolerans TaxID=1146892 RepID=UPI001FD58F19|nr:choline ABC transporter substrate-binding protein [Falsirhodobacter halotolerans]MCJ8138861.1 choline ABC transporter substrate-binding protein [Falsirhodobacter halotolerans]
MTPLKTTLLATAAAVTFASPALAQSACTQVTMSDVGWTDITATTSLTRQILEALGYDVDVDVIGVPVTFASLESGDIDVFLGNWMPSQQSAIGPYLDSGAIETLAANLEGTKYNLVVPNYLAEQGLKTYADLADFADELNNTIYGIEPGNEANEYLIGLTQPGGELEGWNVVQSSEQGMLAQVARFYPREEPVVFLGWAPHPMNASFDLTYLEGGEDFFGGEGVVNTVTRKGFAAECPNVATFLTQQKFTLPMENEMMGLILNDGMTPDDAVKSWVQDNPGAIDTWLTDVTTVDGADGLPVVKKALGL